MWEAALYLYVRATGARPIWSRIPEESVRRALSNRAPGPPLLGRDQPWERLFRLLESYIRHADGEEGKRQALLEVLRYASSST
jgi:hypothetical protein